MTTSREAIGGIAAAVAALGAGHLAALATGRDTSPVPAIANRVVDGSPLALKEFAIATFGTLDKVVLIVGILVVTLALAAAAGLLAGRHRTWGLGLVAALALVGVWAAAPGGLIAVVPSLVTGVVGALALWWLAAPSGTEPVAGRAFGRRGFLRGVVTMGAGGAVAAVIGQSVPSSPATRPTLPAAARPLGSSPTGVAEQAPGVSSVVTPQEVFFRVDTAFTTPYVDLDRWRLVVDGLVEHPLELTWADLISYEIAEVDATLACVSNPVGGEYVGSGRWRGIPTKDLLARAGAQPGADMVLSTSADGFTASTPLECLTDDRGAMVALGLNGEPLSRQHGSPARLLTPGLYGFVGATKWLTRLTVTRFADRSAYWTTRGWSARGPVKLSSRIETPIPSGNLTAGDVVAGGSAWTSLATITGVDVRVDGGAWQPATLGPDNGPGYWRQWYTTLSIPAGSHTLECRAHDSTGLVQSGTPVAESPNGAEGWHLVRLTLR